MEYHSALFEYLSELSGLPEYDEIDITIEERDNLEAKPSLWVKIDDYEYQVSQAFRKGGIRVLETRIFHPDAPYAHKDFPLDFKFDKMYYKKYRSIDDFGIKYKVKENAYKYDEGGGWYSMQDIIIVNDRQFINI